MSAIDKEKIFVELRQYHTDAFPDKLSSPVMEELREEYAELEDTAVSMLLNLVNGKTGYVEMDSEFKAFKEKIKVTKTSEKAEEEDRKFFTAKIEHLAVILDMAKNAIFRLKVPRVAKVAATK